MDREKPSSKPLEPINWEIPPSEFSYILFERVNPVENVERYYYLAWLPTLLHNHAVVRMYGRKGQTQRMVTPQPFDSLDDAWPLIRTIIKTRLRHGYRVVQPAAYCRPS